MQVAIVAGATGGIGFGCATKLAEMGMAVLGTGRDENKLAELRNAIGDPGSRCYAGRRPHCRRRAEADRGLGRFDRWGHIDFLVNNAGVGSPKPLHETDDECWITFWDLMLRAPFRLARDVLPHMGPARRSSTSPRPLPSWAAFVAARIRRQRAG